MLGRCCYWVTVIARACVGRAVSGWSTCIVLSVLRVTDIVYGSGWEEDNLDRMFSWMSFCL